MESDRAVGAFLRKNARTERRAEDGESCVSLAQRALTRPAGAGGHRSPMASTLTPAGRPDGERGDRGTFTLAARQRTKRCDQSPSRYHGHRCRASIIRNAVHSYGWIPPRLCDIAALLFERARIVSDETIHRRGRHDGCGLCHRAKPARGERAATGTSTRGASACATSVPAVARHRRAWRATPSCRTGDAIGGRQRCFKRR